MLTLRTLSVAAVLAFGSLSATAQDAMMASTSTVVETAIGSPDHSTLVAAVQAAGLVDTLNGAGPFTVFAPVNAAFEALPAGTVETLLKPENKDQLTGILTYHVVAGDIHAADLVKLIQDNGGTFKAATVAGGELSFSLDGDTVKVADGAGGTASVTTADIDASNGVIHVVDAVLLPSK